MKFLHKKRQPYYYKRKMIWNHWLVAFRIVSFLLFRLWDWTRVIKTKSLHFRLDSHQLLRSRWQRKYPHEKHCDCYPVVHNNTIISNHCPQSVKHIQKVKWVELQVSWSQVGSWLMGLTCNSIKLSINQPASLPVRPISIFILGISGFLL